MKILIVHELPGALNHLLRSCKRFVSDKASDWSECISACNSTDYDLVLLSSSLDDFPPELLAFFINVHVRKGRKPLRFVLVGPRLEGYPESELSSFGIISHFTLSSQEGALISDIKSLRNAEPIVPYGDPIMLSSLSRLSISLHQSLSTKQSFSESSRDLKQENQELVFSLKFLRRRIASQSKSSVISMITAAEARDPYMRGHIKMVEKLSVAIGRKLSLSEDQLEIISCGALMHDIGKIGIPDRILNKRGVLTTEEIAVIRSHPVFGVKILEKNPAFFPYLDIVLSHHERLDGSGYPDGKVGSEIPFLAQIVSVADVVSALITDRPYRSSIRPKASAQFIQDCKGKTLNADAVEALTDVLREEETMNTPAVYSSSNEPVSHFLRHITF